MKDRNLVGALKTSTGLLGGGILTLLACGAFACTEVNVNPVAVGGSAGSSADGGRAGSVGQGGSGGTPAGNGGSSDTGGTGGTSGLGGTGGSSGTAGTGGTGGSSTGGTGGTGPLPDAGDPGPVNLVANPDFELGLAPWTMIAQQGTIVRHSDCNGTPDPDAGVSDAGEPEQTHGLWCGRGTSRTAAYQGPAYPLNGILTRGKTYTVSAFGRIAKGEMAAVDYTGSSVLKLTMRVMCTMPDGIGLPVGYTNLVNETPVTDSEWLFMTGEYTVPGTTECPTMTDLRVYLEGPPSGIDILVDDLSIYEL